MKESAAKEYFDFKDEASRNKFKEDMETSDLLHGCFLSEYRTHIVSFDANIKSHTEIIKVCPLCELHPDSQDSMEDCRVLKKHHQNIQQIKNLYKERYDRETIDLLCKVLKTRQTLIENSQI